VVVLMLLLPVDFISSKANLMEPVTGKINQRGEGLENDL
jgi:hypothetical protein